MILTTTAGKVGSEPNPMNSGPQHPRSQALRSKDTVIATLRRARMDPETIEALERELQDPVDPNRDGNLLFAHGITRERLMDRLGASP